MCVCVCGLEEFFSCIFVLFHQFYPSYTCIEPYVAVEPLLIWIKDYMFLCRGRNDMSLCTDTFTSRNYVYDLQNI
jgi:hypothetical protein